jgi:hypothetical protein
MLLTELFIMTCMRGVIVTIRRRRKHLERMTLVMMTMVVMMLMMGGRIREKALSTRLTRRSKILRNSTGVPNGPLHRCVCVCVTPCHCSHMSSSSEIIIIIDMIYRSCTYSHHHSYHRHHLTTIYPSAL